MKVASRWLFSYLAMTVAMTASWGAIFGFEPMRRPVMLTAAGALALLLAPLFFPGTSFPWARGPWLQRLIWAGAVTAGVCLAVSLAGPAPLPGQPRLPYSFAITLIEWLVL